MSRQRALDAVSEGTADCLATALAARGALIVALLSTPVVTAQSRTASYLQASVPITADRVMNIQLPDGYLATGMVVDGSGAPIAGALVLARSDAGFVEAAVLSDASGSFVLPLRTGTYGITAAPPFAAAPSGVSRLVASSRQGVTVSGDTSLAGFVLGTGFLVTGKVTTSGGAVSFLRCLLLATSADPGGPVIPGVTDETMSEAVSYACALPPGRYVLQVTNAYGYTSTWRPAGLSAFAGAKTITVSNDVTKNIKLPKGYPVTGTLTDSAGNTLSGGLYAQAARSDPRKDGRATTLTVANGVYIGSLPAGAYDGVFVPLMDPNTYVGRGTRTPISFRVTSAGSTLSLIAQDGVLVSGKVTDSSRRPVRDVWVEIRGSPSAPGLSQSDIPVVAKTDAKGYFRAAVPAGAYDVHVSPPPDLATGKGLPSSRIPR